MKYPKKLKIGAHEVKLEVVDHWKGDNSDQGQFDDELNTLFVRATLSDTRKFATLIHESMHVMNATLNHELLDSLSEQIAQMLIDNGFVKLDDESPSL